MQSFLEEIVDQIRNTQVPLEHTVFVLPSKRAGTFLRNYIAKTSKGKTIFSPNIYSIEGFVEEISCLSLASHTQQIFELYYSYLEQNTGENDSFIDFSKWGQTLLQDINEIDRYLIDSKKLFAHLSAIQEINHWYVQAEKTKLVEDYIQFWNNLEDLYRIFNQRLLDQDMGHQGLIYRKACDNLEPYLESNAEKTFFFIGFNALNTAESTIIQRVLKTPNANIYWDVDTYFLNDPIHDAGLFIRNHKRNWPYLQKKQIEGSSSNFISPKKIQVVGVPKNISQVKYAGKLLKQLHLEQGGRLSNTAVVLSDETLLNPLLNSIPKEIEKVNITMGYPLNKTLFDDFFMQFLDLYIHKQTNGWYYKNILSFLSNSHTQILLNKGEIDIGRQLSGAINNKNLAYLNVDQINSSVTSEDPNLSLLFFDVELKPKLFVKRCLDIILKLKTELHMLGSSVALEELYKFYEVFNQVLVLSETHSFIKDLRSLKALLQELLSLESLDFQGDPIEGLQIMGMLESRNLDFETVIITSVNEGILPSGKSNNSFIPFDLKRNFGLPTFKEKDAVYTYHFYRLLQRAKNIFLIYNTEPDVLEGGERSRLITQLLTDENIKDRITKFIAVPEIKTSPKKHALIPKNDSLMTIIQKHAANGFSPSSLTNYIRNPIDFYKQNLLGINDIPEVEETVAANTFGTIIHDTLEDLYQPIVGAVLTQDFLLASKKRVKELVKRNFVKTYSDAAPIFGKNLLALNVIIKYVEDYLDLELLETKKHQIRILGLEQKLHLKLEIPELEYPVVLKGKLDRIDEKDGVLRIIDYKSGKVLANQVEIFDCQELTNDHNLSKAFQLLCYTLMYDRQKKVGQIEAGILSFKNLNAGLLRFATKEHRNSRSKDRVIKQETLSQFEIQLKKLILEICNPNIPFEEKEA